MRERSNKLQAASSKNGLCYFVGVVRIISVLKSPFNSPFKACPELDSGEGGEKEAVSFDSVRPDGYSHSIPSGLDCFY